MERWRDELLKHPIHVTLSQIETALDQEFSTSDSSNEVERARVRKITTLFKNVLASLDPHLAPIDIIGEINSQLQNQGALSTAQQIIKNSDPSLFRTLNDQLRPILSYLAQVRMAVAGTDTSGADLSAATSAFESFSASLDIKSKELLSAISQSQEKISKAAELMSSREDEFATLKGEFQASLVEWNKEHSDLLNSHNTKMSTSLTQAVNNAENTISELRTKGDAELKAFFEALEGFSKDQKESLQEKLTSIIEDAEAKHRGILDFYGLVALDSVTGGHKRIADRELSDANNWRWITVGSIGVTVLWVLYSLFGMSAQIEPTQVFWLQVGKSVSLTALLISFAVYASRQAAIHRINERRARSFFLQVQAFDPFVATLPEDAKTELKVSLSQKIFSPVDSRDDRVAVEEGDFQGIERTIGLIERFKKLIAKS